MAVMHQNRKNNILLGQNDNALTWLIVINAVVFVSLFFIRLVYQLTIDSDHGDFQAIFEKNIQSWLTLPASFQMLIHRPWTLLTHMFVHNTILGLVSTTLWLWAFGYILQDLAGNNKLFPVYIYGGIVSGILFVIAENIIPGLRAHIANTSDFLGGSASVIAIAVAVTTLAPRYKLLPMLNGGVPLWVFSLVFIVIEYVSVVGINGAYALAFAGAAFVGFFFIRQLRRGYDWGAWMTSAVNWTDDLFNPAKKHAEEPEKQKLFYKATKKPYEKKTVVTQQRVDELLDKINQQGYHLLTDEEKEFLKKASEQDFSR